jgi:hypothetical protein
VVLVDRSLGHAFSVVKAQAGVAELLIDARPDEARRALAEIRPTIYGAEGGRALRGRHDRRLISANSPLPRPAAAKIQKRL